MTACIKSLAFAYFSREFGAAHSRAKPWPEIVSNSIDESVRIPNGLFEAVEKVEHRYRNVPRALQHDKSLALACACQGNSAPDARKLRTPVSIDAPM
jgi:hypothetical protein